MTATATEPVFACLETGFGRKSADDAWVWAPQRVNAGGLAGSCSPHEWVIGWVIETACGYRGATGVDCHLGWMSETENAIVPSRSMSTGLEICVVCHRGEGLLGHQACRSRGRGQDPGRTRDHRHAGEAEESGKGCVLDRNRVRDHCTSLGRLPGRRASCLLGRHVIDGSRTPLVSCGLLRRPCLLRAVPRVVLVWLTALNWPYAACLLLDQLHLLGLEKLLGHALGTGLGTQAEIP